mmetsp:Transcript_4335/g.10841  ORF Transcript_4335/g.10841 Transcript_4335/m.10841 type:complete len:307 (-) Transcript_4335:33-953(-)
MLPSSPPRARPSTHAPIAPAFPPHEAGRRKSQTTKPARASRFPIKNTEKNQDSRRVQDISSKKTMGVKRVRASLGGGGGGFVATVLGLGLRGGGRGGLHVRGLLGLVPLRLDDGDFLLLHLPEGGEVRLELVADLALLPLLERRHLQRRGRKPRAAVHAHGVPLELDLQPGVEGALEDDLEPAIPPLLGRHGQHQLGQAEVVLLPAGGPLLDPGGEGLGIRGGEADLEQLLLGLGLVVIIVVDLCPEGGRAALLQARTPEGGGAEAGREGGARGGRGGGGEIQGGGEAAEGESVGPRDGGEPEAGH